ncbi:hypothetical protein C1H46_039700 [Malus baccata]|uniref:Uncharacterized protein n=1 Tax=Malus baccata TaxID=106549 RepID=A0A540KKL9_MALBA|nr:hypothetical protein C1H46_039700 [Malus baccata]
MNNVPHTTFLLTHVCFLFYHVISNITLRRLRHFTAGWPEQVQWVAEAAWILALSYFIAYLETIAISNVLAKVECGSSYMCSFITHIPLDVFLLILSYSI